MDADGLEIRSFRVVFDLERRIHRIDRFRVPLPYGLPLRSVAYAGVGLLVVLVMRQLPGVGPLLRLLPVPAQLVLVPAVISCVLTRLRLDGRSAHAAAESWLRYRCRPRRVVAFRAAPPTGEVALGDLALVREVVR